MTTNTPHWYAAKTENAHDQGLVIDEETGENIAVTYKSENAPKIAALPELLEAVGNLLTELEERQDITVEYHQEINACRFAYMKAKNG